MKKYRVTYEMRYTDDIYGSMDVAQYTTEFNAEEEYSYVVAIALCPVSTPHLRWLINTLEELV